MGGGRRGSRKKRGVGGEPMGMMRVDQGSPVFYNRRRAEITITGYEYTTISNKN
jgi:hypothetical protein